MTDRFTCFALVPPGRTPPGPASSGFSLVEVVLALVVAAGGLLSIFGLMPGALRQSQLARTDLSGSGFGSTLLQTFAGNIRTIDDIGVWNDPMAFWDVACKGTGIRNSSALKKGSDVRSWYKSAVPDQKGKYGQFTNPDSQLSPMTTRVAEGYPDNVSSGEMDVWYLSREKQQGTATIDSQPAADVLVEPAQYLIRLARIRRKARRLTGFRDDGKDPNRIPKELRDEIKFGGRSTVSDEEGGDDAWLPNVYVISVVSSDRGFPDVFYREPVYSQEFTFFHRP